MEQSISILQILNILKKRWNLITLIILVSVLISGSISYLVLTPIYQASTQILVNQKNSENQLDLGQLQSNVDLINTYGVIIKSPAILKKVIEDLELTLSVEELNQNILVNSQENSQVFSLTVEHSDADMAVEIVNSISETFQNEIPGIMNVNNVSILAKAELNEEPTPVKPNPLLNVAIAVIVSLIFGVGLVFILEYLDNTLKDSHDVEVYIGLPVLGTIQEVPKQKVNKGYTKHKMGVETLESYAKK